MEEFDVLFETGKFLAQMSDQKMKSSNTFGSYIHRFNGERQMKLEESAGGCSSPWCSKAPPFSAAKLTLCSSSTGGWRRRGARRHYRGVRRGRRGKFAAEIGDPVKNGGRGWLGTYAARAHWLRRCDATFDIRGAQSHPQLPAGGRPSRGAEREPHVFRERRNGRTDPADAEEARRCTRRQ